MSVYRSDDGEAERERERARTAHAANEPVRPFHAGPVIAALTLLPLLVIGMTWSQKLGQVLCWGLFAALMLATGVGWLSIGWKMRDR